MNQKYIGLESDQSLQIQKGWKIQFQDLNNFLIIPLNPPLSWEANSSSIAPAASGEEDNAILDCFASIFDISSCPMLCLDELFINEPRRMGKAMESN